MPARHASMARRPSQHVPAHTPAGTRAAFTLIELLVVISIIALLIAILLPALQAARITAQGMQSSSNVRQLTIGLHTYANDHDSSLPWGRVDAVPNGTNAMDHTWAAALRDQEYVLGPDVYWSPGRQLEWIKGSNADDHYNEDGSAVGDWFLYPGYSANSGGAMPEQDSGVDPVRLGTSEAPPSNLLLMVESYRVQDYRDNDRDGWWKVAPDTGNSGPSGPANGNSPLFAYNGGVARAYLDGHAAIGNPEEIGYNATGPRTGQWLFWQIHAPDGLAAFNAKVGKPWYSLSYTDRW